MNYLQLVGYLANKINIDIYESISTFILVAQTRILCLMVEPFTFIPADCNLAKEERAVKLSIKLADNPYEKSALATVNKLRDEADMFLQDSGFSTNEVQLHYAGQTAEQADIQQMNKRDMIVLFAIVIVLLTIILGIQTRSVILPVIMMFTILLSYTATLGFGWFILKDIMGYEAISYRIPMYTFIFMVALGIDYNIILVSRIRELANELTWREAVGEGVALTGGVISSAGLILAATFGVLMTQPLEELSLFGFTVALGILLTTFVIAVVLLPSILILTVSMLTRKKVTK